MRKNQLKLAKPGAETIGEALGLTEERTKEVIKKTEETVKKSIDGGKDKADTIVEVWNQFDNDGECAFAMFILEHAEENVMVSKAFGTSIPESVATED